MIDNQTLAETSELVARAADRGGARCHFDGVFVTRSDSTFCASSTA
jgi:hypothetical protein